MKPRLILCVLGAMMFSCTKPESKTNEEAASAPAEHHDEEEHEELPSKVTLSAEVIKQAGIKTEPSRMEPLVQTIGLPGELVANPDKSARVASPVAGRMEQVFVQEGAKVKKGDPLFTVRIPELGRVRSSQAGTSTKAKAARANADRLKDLAGKGLASQQQLIEADAEARALETEASALSDQLQAMGAGEQGSASLLTVRTPVTGVVIARNAVVGQPLTTEEVAIAVADLDELWFLGRVFEKDLGKLRTGAAAEVQLNALPDERFASNVDYVGKQVDPSTRTLTARISLKNRDELLRIGMFGTARVALKSAAEAKPVLTVARNALTEIGGKQVVFVRQPDAHFEMHEVVVGESSQGRTQILSGLREGEAVVVDGVFTLKSAVLKSTFAEEEE